MTERSTSWQTLKGKARSGWPQKGKISTDYKESNQTSVGPYSREQENQNVATIGTLLDQFMLSCK